MTPDPLTLLVIIDTAYDRKSWHGTNLRGSIRGLTARQAAWRPSAKRHSIWELVVHCAYWKYTALRRLSEAPRGSFALKGSNWFERRDQRDDRAWRADVALLDRTHRELRGAVEKLTPADLRKRRAAVRSATSRCFPASPHTTSITRARFSF